MDLPTNKPYSSSDLAVAEAILNPEEERDFSICIWASSIIDLLNNKPIILTWTRRVSRKSARQTASS
jgi:hypothetical protein